MLGAVLALSTVLVQGVPAAMDGVSDAQVLQGVAQVNDGEYDAAILTLDAAVRRLAPSSDKARDLAAGFLYLGVAYLAKGHEASARIQFREALKQSQGMTLSPEGFAPRVIEEFNKAREGIAPAAPPAAVPDGKAAPARRGHGKAVAIAGGVAAAGAAVALAAKGGRDPETVAFTVGASSEVLPLHGQPGGQPFTASCPPGSVVTGLTGRATSVGLVRVMPLCSPLLANGGTGSSTVPSVSEGDGAPFQESCPAGQAMVQLTGAQTVSDGISFVGRVGGGCASVPDWVRGAAAVAPLPSHGSALGAPFSDTCPSDSVLVALAGRAGDLLDQLQGLCARVNH